MSGAAGECAQIRGELGVYLLGAIGSADRIRVGRHLASCRRCREELAGLASLPGLLRSLPPAEVATTWTQDATESLRRPSLDSLISRMIRLRGRRRLAAALAGALLAGLAAVAGLQASRAPGAPPAPVTGSCATSSPSPPTVGR